MDKKAEKRLLRQIFSGFSPRRSEFLISSPKYGTAYIDFRSGGQSTTLELSTKEWRNLQKFLKVTVRKIFPQGSVGYRGVHLQRGIIFGYNKEREHGLVNEWKKKWNKSDEWKKREYRKIERRVQYMKKHFLDSKVELSRDDMTVYLSREKFLKFRKEFLNVTGNAPSEPF